MAREIRAANLYRLVEAGIDLLPTNDFSLYDQVLDAAVLVGAVPARYHDAFPDDALARYFAMARGVQAGGVDLAPLPMTKWFDTNYHHLVPEVGRDTALHLDASKVVDELAEAGTTEGTTMPGLLGPVTFLLLSEPAPDGDAFDPLTLLPALVDVYEELLAELGARGAAWVRLDEPAFAADRRPAELDALRDAYHRLGAVTGAPPVCVSTFFDHAGDALGVLLDTPVDGIGLDFCAGPANVRAVEAAGGLGDKVLFAGVVDGRNVWANHLSDTFGLLEHLAALNHDQVVVSTSCSLQHVPVSAAAEPALDPELRTRLAFAEEKLHEVAVLARGLADGRDAVAGELAARRSTVDRRTRSRAGVDPTVRARVAALRPSDARRDTRYPQRRALQARRLGLPAFPTTTIGSFPQTTELRTARAATARGELSEAGYEARIRTEVDAVIDLQERLGLDVLVTGEPERNDMVQFFAERLDGFAVTAHGWVQSFGTRCTRPPIVVGDVSRPAPMTVELTRHAQQRTAKPVKGMLTGPVTMLQWSFPRDDLARAETCRQIALALRDEVRDLEAAGIAIVQVDEPAFREGLPLRSDRRAEYLAWATECFRLATGAARAETQIHTHMCYSEFGSIMPAVADLDVDVISFEAARSHMEILDELRASGFDRDVGPGVYDIHSPRVPTVEAMLDLLEQAAAAVPGEHLWVNPDCGLKTRRYTEVEPALANLVEAAHHLRATRP